MWNLAIGRDDSNETAVQQQELQLKERSSAVTPPNLRGLQKNHLFGSIGLGGNTVHR